jgi:ureidoacrylate peracid hydrolase
MIDPFNDFISEGGKVWDRRKGVAEANKCVPHMIQVLDAARKAGIRVFCALHHRHCANSEGIWSRKTFEYGTWGGEIRHTASISSSSWSS